MNTIVIILVIAAYFGIIFAVSAWTTRRHDGDTNSFYRGNRKSPWYVVAIAMVGTSISGVTYVSVPGMVAQSQMSYLQMVLGFVAGYFVVAYVLLPLYYKLNLSSIYTYLQQRYGASSHITGASFFLLSKFLGCAVRMYLTAVVLQLVLFEPLGIPFAVTVTLMMLVVWINTYKGGVKTLVWTDLLQTLCLLSAMVGFVFCVMNSMGLSFSEMTEMIQKSEMSRVWYFDDVNDTRFFWKQFLAGMFTTVAMTGMDQDMMQKNLSCKSLKEAQKNMVSYGFAFLPVNFIFLTLGILLYAYAMQLGVCTQSADGSYLLTDLTGQALKSDQLFPYLATGFNPSTGENFLPMAVTILFVLGLVSAAFSSAGSAVTSLTTALMVDFPFKLKRTRVHLANAILMGTMIYIFHLLASGSVINAVYVIASYTYGPLLGLFFFGLLTKCKPRDKFIPIVCIISPLLCWVLDSNSEAWFGGYHIGYELLLINGFITAFGLYLISLHEKTKQQSHF